MPCPFYVLPVYFSLDSTKCIFVVMSMWCVHCSPDQFSGKKRKFASDSPPMSEAQYLQQQQQLQQQLQQVKQEPGMSAEVSVSVLSVYSDFCMF